jgi:hypothetical protein
MTDKIYKFSVNGLSGSLESVFLATEEEIIWITGKQIWFGNVLGKHSSLAFTMQPEHFTVLSEDIAAVERFKNTVKFSGNCPFNYLENDHLEEYAALFPQKERVS